jgi:hypothetical protein
MAAQRGRSERDAEAYFQYVEALSDARTKLADFFSLLPNLSMQETA